MKSTICLALLALFITLTSSKFSISRFQGPPFTAKPPSGTYDIGGLGFDDITNGNQILAYGDFNNDKYTDILTMADDLRTLTVFLYSHEDYTFSQFTIINSGKTVASVITGDFNYDGLLDLLVLTLSSDLKITHLNYYIRTEVAPYFGTDGAPTVSYDLDGQVQPFVLDVKGNRKLDIMFMEGGERKIQTYEDGQLTTESFSKYISSTEGCLPATDALDRSFANPHSNAFVDFNGDCAADLFITSVDTDNNLFVEVWLRDKDKPAGSDAIFCLMQSQQVQLPNVSAISQISIGDMDANGRMDLIFASMPTDETEPMNLHIIYNMISVDTSTPCSVDSAKAFPFSADSFYLADTLESVRLVTPIVGGYSNATRLFSPDSVNRPAKFRIGDINNDGYPDLLFVINDPASLETLYGSIVLAISDAGTFTFNQNATQTEDTGYYSLLDEETLTATGDVRLDSVPTLYASFFDFDEQGHLGMWIVTADSTSPATTLIAAFNYVATQNFILKTLGLNGVPPIEEDDITSSLGGLYYGASFECRVTDMNAKVSIYKGVQMPQSSYSPLDLPYMYVGIGKTSNYIENFIMGIADTTGTSTDVQQTEWTPIIPNSQLIVNPLVDSSWTLDVFVNPTSETTLIGIVVLVILVLLGAIVIYMQSEETKRDIELKEQEGGFGGIGNLFNRM